MTNVNKTRKHVKYAKFHVASSNKKDTFCVDGFNGNLGDALKKHNKR